MRSESRPSVSSERRTHVHERGLTLQAGLVFDEGAATQPARATAAQPVWVLLLCVLALEGGGGASDPMEPSARMCGVC
jgi:hypothetical protein